VVLSTLDAQLRAAVVLSGVAESGPLERCARAVTAEPRLDDTTLADVPSLVVRPGRAGVRPAVVLLNGVTARGRAHPRIRRLALALARAGLVVCVPDPPGLARGPVSLRTRDATVAVVQAATELPDVARVGLLGVSIGATLALLAAEDETLAEELSVVAGIAPHVDFVGALRLAVDPAASAFARLVFARSLLAALPPGAERDELLARLDAVADDDLDPLAPLLQPGAEGGVRAVAELLLDGAASFDERYAALPDSVRSELVALSPLAGAGRLRAPVELAAPRTDKYVPREELAALKRAAAHTTVRVSVTSALDHADPRLDLRALGDLARFDGWVVRTLRAALRP
jgi:pimeloyl-ACP methyl ester carboxylesterase